MARKAALVVSWTHPVRGREGKALEGFMDFLTFWGKRAADGKNQDPEPFFSIGGGNGFAIIRGSSDALQEALESEEFEKVLSKGQLNVEGLKIEMYVTGDEEIQRGMRIYSEAASELGYL